MQITQHDCKQSYAIKVTTEKGKKEVYYHYLPVGSTCYIYSLGVIPVVSLKARKKVVYELKPHNPANAFKV